MSFLFFIFGGGGVEPNAYDNDRKWCTNKGPSNIVTVREGITFKEVAHYNFQNGVALLLLAHFPPEVAIWWGYKCCDVSINLYL